MMINEQAQVQACSTLQALLCAQNKQLFAPLYKTQALSRRLASALSSLSRLAAFRSRSLTRLATSFKTIACSLEDCSGISIQLCLHVLP